MRVVTAPGVVPAGETMPVPSSGLASGSATGILVLGEEASVSGKVPARLLFGRWCMQRFHDRLGR